MLATFSGMIRPGYQFASGKAVGRKENPSPFGKGTLKRQQPYLKAAGVDLKALVPGLYWGTINLEIDRKLVLVRGDFPPAHIDWTVGLKGKGRIPAESFSFVRCCFVYASSGDPGEPHYYPGLLYYPHPETKPGTNQHHYDVLEILACEVPNLAYGRPASVICRADAFRSF